MHSRDVQEEFLEHRRFQVGRKEASPNKWLRVRVSGLCLIIAAGVGFFSPAYRVVQGEIGIGLMLGCGSLLSAAFAFVDRTGLTSLITASTVLTSVVGAVVFLPLENLGRLELGALAFAVFLFWGSFVCAVLGLLEIVLGVIVVR